MTALVRLGLVSARRARQRRREYRRRERGRPMELWQLDVMGGVLLTDGSELKAVTAIDDCSRFALGVGLARRATTRLVCTVFASSLSCASRDYYGTYVLPGLVAVAMFAPCLLGCRGAM